MLTFDYEDAAEAIKGFQKSALRKLLKSDHVCILNLFELALYDRRVLHEFLREVLAADTKRGKNLAVPDSLYQEYAALADSWTIRNTFFTDEP